MRADRLIAALLLLQSHKRLSSRTLAERLDVCERTVHRDMEALGAAGVPVFAIRGAQGGWQLDENWRTRVPGLDDAELRALLMAQPRVIGDPRLAASAERALSKLIAALPGSLRERASSIRERLYVDTSGWSATTEDLSSLPIVQEAVTRDRRLAIRYRRNDRSHATRVVDPLGLVAKGPAWYLVAATAKGFRTFRVSRIEEPRVLDQDCRRPPRFNLAAHWRASTEQFRSIHRYAATLRLEPSAAEYVRTWCRVLSSAASRHQQEEPQGRVTLRVAFEDESHARFVVLGLGAGVEVVEPSELHDRVASEIAAMSEQVGRRRRRANDAP